MTVAYMEYTHTAGTFGIFTRVLRIWKGSLFKGIGRDLAMFCTLYTLISVVYRYVLVQDEFHKQNFEILAVYCSKFSHRIPLSFLLGFYVSQVVSRWWDQWRAMSWPDSLAMQLTTYLNACRSSRRSIVRWACLSQVLTLRCISTKVARRFPTLEHLVEAGLLTIKELEKLDDMLAKTEGRHDISWLPIQWAQELARQCAREKGTLPGDLPLSNIHGSLLQIATNNRTLYMYGWISIPLVYTQVVTIAVYLYFLAALFGRQYLHPQEYVKEGGVYVRADGPAYATADKKNLIGYDMFVVDMIIPCFTLLEFLFYFGWLKVAESLINPFGDDDDDFETNYIIDRNLQLSYLMVECPEVDLEDPFGEDEMPPTEMPHTISSLENRDLGPQMPTDKVILDELEMSVTADEQAELISSTDPRRPSLMNRFNKIGGQQRRPSIKSSISNKQRLEHLKDEQGGHQQGSRIARSVSVQSQMSRMSRMSQMSRMSRMSRMGSLFRRPLSNNTTHSNFNSALNSRANSIKSCRTIDSLKFDVPDTIVEQVSEVSRPVAGGRVNLSAELDQEGQPPNQQAVSDIITFQAKEMHGDASSPSNVKALQERGIIVRGSENTDGI